ncbi:hypothetical protein PMIN07_008581 [Paraphaeosphaeria minitans]
MAGRGQTKCTALCHVRPRRLLVRMAACWKGQASRCTHTPTPACGEAPQGSFPERLNVNGRGPMHTKLAISRSELEGRTGNSTCEMMRLRVGKQLDKASEAWSAWTAWTFVDSPPVRPTTEAEIEGRVWVSDDLGAAAEGRRKE